MEEHPKTTYKESRFVDTSAHYVKNDIEKTKQRKKQKRKNT